MTNPFKKPDARQQRDSVPDEMRRLYNNVAALRATVEGWEAVALARAKNAEPNGLDGWAPGQYQGNLLLAADERWAPAKAVLDSLEASPDYIAAAKTIEPILKALGELQVAEEAARQLKQAKVNALAESLAKANEVARLKAESDPAVVAARRELDALNAV